MAGNKISIMKIALVGLLLPFCSTFAPLTAQARAAQIQTLPGPNLVSSGQILSTKTFRLHNFRAKNKFGNALSVPAHLLDVYSYAKFWDSAQPGKVPPLPIQLSKSIRKKVQLFYTNKDSFGLGWTLVPRGWVVKEAAIAATGGITLGFAPPPSRSSRASNSYSGSMVLGKSAGPMPDLLDSVAGLIPDVAHAFKQTYQLWAGTLDLPRPNEALFPKPTAMKHPNPCTAIFTYSRSGKIMHGAVYLGESPDGTPAYVSSIYFSLPEKDPALSKYIIDTFLKGQIVPGYCAGNEISG